MTNYKEQYKYWANRNELIQPYLKEKLMNRSHWLAEELKAYEFDSIFEMGCYNGRNLKVIKEHFPEVEIAGLDINPQALAFAKDYLPEGTSLQNTDILNVDLTKKFDVVFTHGVLLHIPPDGLSQVLDKCIEKSSKYIVHLERWEQGNRVLRGPKEYHPEIKSVEWRWAPEFTKMYIDKGIKVLQHRTVKIAGSGKPSTFTVLEK